jgi:eukaryotic-like serine/threonine-protein kinase
MIARLEDAALTKGRQPEPESPRADPIAAAAVAAAPDLAGESRAEALALVQRALFAGDATFDAYDTPGSGSRPRVRPGRGSTIGRYVVLDGLGEGAMGTVTRAYDPKLRREVALKRLVARLLARDGAARLLREAQAMAQLTHPNVVGVHDVETEGDEVVLVMEYVPGRTLRQWLETTRDWREILAAFASAGEGLAAAHRVGIVHRDFKPSNVLVADDGTVKVTDFGLAKAVSSHAPVTASVDGSIDAPIDEPSASLTQADAVVGTPRYMAPEQHAGHTDARVDQFSFCVALWEALCAAPPYGGRTLDELSRAKRAGPPTWTGPRLPKPTLAALRRGLAADPEQRWPAMPALLAALTPPSHARKLAWMAGGALVGVLALSAGLGTMMAGPAPCSGSQQALGGIWDDARRSEVQVAFVATGAPYAAAAAEGASETLDAWSERWVLAHRETCEALRAAGGHPEEAATGAAARGELSAELLDLRMACLGRAQRELAATTRTLARADVNVVDHVDALVGELPTIESCAEVEALRAELSPPGDPATAALVTEARAELSEARALHRAGHYRQARAVVEASISATAAIDYPPLHAEAGLLLGEVLEAMGEYPAAEVKLRAALEQALATGAWPLAAQTAALLAVDVGFSQRRIPDGKLLAELAVGLAEGARGDGDVLAQALIAASRVAEVRGDLDRAERDARRAIDLRRALLGAEHLRVAAAELSLAAILERRGHAAESHVLAQHVLDVRRRVLGPDHPEVAATKNVLGIVHLAQGRYSEAETFYREAIDDFSGSLGPEHVLVAHATANLGLALHHQGRFAEAETLHRRALARREAAFGVHHSVTLESLNNLGLTLQALGRLDEAQATFERVLAGRTARLGPAHPGTTAVANNLGIVQLVRGRHAEAEVSFQHAATRWAEQLGADHPHVGAAYNNLGLALAEQGRSAEAEAAWRRALEIWERGLPADHRDLGRVLHNLGEALVDRGEVVAARELLERAWTIRAASKADGLGRAETAFALGQAVKAGDPARAEELFERARHELAAVGEEGDALREALAVVGATPATR